jgi:uncharacterized membrane protein
MTTVQKTFSIAATAAMMAMTGIGVAAHAAEGAKAGEKLVHCYGVNTCKGTSDCATAKTSCKGQNECKGTGFISTTAKKCTSMGGSLTEPK